MLDYVLMVIRKSVLRSKFTALPIMLFIWVNLLLDSQSLNGHTYSKDILEIPHEM